MNSSINVSTRLEMNKVSVQLANDFWFCKKQGNLVTLLIMKQTNFCKRTIVSCIE